MKLVSMLSAALSIVLPLMTFVTKATLGEDEDALYAVPALCDADPLSEVAIISVVVGDVDEAVHGTHLRGGAVVTEGGDISTDGGDCMAKSCLVLYNYQYEVNGEWKLGKYGPNHKANIPLVSCHQFLGSWPAPSFCGQAGLENCYFRYIGTFERGRKN